MPTRRVSHFNSVSQVRRSTTGLLSVETNALPEEEAEAARTGAHSRLTRGGEKRGEGGLDEVQRHDMDYPQLMMNWAISKILHHRIDRPKYSKQTISSSVFL